METLEKNWRLYQEGRLPAEDLANLVRDIGESPLLNRQDIRDTLVELMSNCDELVRQNALGALAYHGLAVDWEADFGRQLLSAMDIMLRFDESRDCRRQAAAAFGSLFKGKKHRGVMAALGRVSVNRDEGDDVRSFAYTGLLSVSGVPLHAQPNPVGLKLSVRETSHIDRLLAEIEGK